MCSFFILVYFLLPWCVSHAPSRSINQIPVRETRTGAPGRIMFRTPGLLMCSFFYISLFPVWHHITVACKISATAPGRLTY